MPVLSLHNAAARLMSLPTTHAMEITCSKRADGIIIIMGRGSHKGPRNRGQTSHKFHVLTRGCVSVTKFLCEGEAAAQGHTLLTLLRSRPEHPMVGSFSLRRITPTLGPELVPMCRDKPNVL